MGAAAAAARPEDDEEMPQAAPHQDAQQVAAAVHAHMQPFRTPQHAPVAPVIPVRPRMHRGTRPAAFDLTGSAAAAADDDDDLEMTSASVPEYHTEAWWRENGSAKEYRNALLAYGVPKDRWIWKSKEENLQLLLVKQRERYGR